MPKTKYKLHSFRFETYKDWWVFPLAITFNLNNIVYWERNFQIAIHFLCFHVRWFWVAERSGEE